MATMYLWSKLMKKVRGSAIVDSSVHKTAKVESGCHMVRSSLSRHSFCGYDCEIYYCDIGAFTSIANDVKIGGGRHPIEWVSMSPVFYKGRDSVKAKFSSHARAPVRKTTIGNDVWIGANVLISQGITVGNGAVIGMGSVVTKDVPDYAIVVGNPAVAIRKRFDEVTIARLLASEWWEFSDEVLLQYAPLFTDPRKFLEMFEAK